MSGMVNIYQSIEILGKEKGIDPSIILDAVKDAMLVAARKHFHTEEELVAELNDRILAYLHLAMPLTRDRTSAACPRALTP